MGMDGLCLYASCLEMQTLLNGKIEKVSQPERDEIVLSVRANGEQRLLLSASAAHCGAYLTEQKRANPINAPMFCMLLRKHLVGGRILRIEQPGLDRLLRIEIRARDDFGDAAQYTLIAEVMGKHSNIILLQADGRIIDAIKRVGLDISAVRLIQPGLLYALPPQQEKADPREASREDFLAVLAKSGRADKNLSAAFYGLSPAVAAAMLSRVSDTLDASLMQETQREEAASWLFAFYQALAAGRFMPYVQCDDLGNPLCVYPFCPSGNYAKAFPSIKDAMDFSYACRDSQTYMQQHGASVRKVLQNNIERCEKKLSLYAAAIADEAGMERDRRFGELLTANLHRLRGNAPEAVVTDYYADPPAEVVVPMDKQHTPGENAQRYFKKYQKAKASREMALVQREQALAELAYLEGQLENLGNCTTEAELRELADELCEQGYIRRERGKGKPRKLPPSQPWHYVSSDGTDIYVGKNNRQNDALTLRFAAGDDLWLHAKDIPGSHVIVKSAAPAEKTLFEAALLAAYYSKARGSGNVPVDYTPRKFVKKPSGAKPGMVIYTTNHTAYVTPEERLIKAIERVN